MTDTDTKTESDQKGPYMHDITDKVWHHLPLDDVDFEGGNWGWDHGGQSLRDDQIAITHIEDATLHKTRYVLPDCITEMIRQRERHARDDALKKVRLALGLDR